MQEKRFGLWKCYSCKSLIPDSIVQTHTVPFRILESQDDNWKHIWKTWQALILSFKWWPCGTSRKLQLFHNISCSCCRKFRPTFALSWVMCGLNKACPGHWNFSPFHQLIKWQGNPGADPRFFQRGGCKYESSRQTSQNKRNGGGRGGHVWICRFSSFWLQRYEFVKFEYSATTIVVCLLFTRLFNQSD